MRRYSKIQLIFPVMKQQLEQKSPNNNKDLNKIFSVGLSTLLIISESLPFFDNVKSNGILDILKNVSNNLNDNLKKN